MKKARNMKSVSQAKLPYFEGIFKLWKHEQQELPFLQMFISFAKQNLAVLCVKRISFFLVLLYEVYWLFRITWLFQSIENIFWKNRNYFEHFLLSAERIYIVPVMAECNTGLQSNHDHHSAWVTMRLRE